MASLLSRRARMIFFAAAVALALVLVVAIAFPVGLLKSMAERRLTERFGRAVTIASLERENRFSLSPVFRVTGVRVSQAAWAGSGDLATVRLVRVRMHLLPLLAGRFSPDLIDVSGVRLDLVRTADGRTNWSKPDAAEVATGGEGPRLDALSVTDAVVRYRDAKQARAFTIGVRVDPVRGLIAEGRGEVDGAAVRILVRGGPVRRAGGWPFSASLNGPLLAMHATGRMAAPLATNDMRFHVTARADDLKRIDRVIDAGLFSSQPVTLTADVVHRNARWHVANLKGMIGRSDFSGQITAARSAGRVRVDGELHSRALDFDDLASDEGLAKAAAVERSGGTKLVPNTRVNLAHLIETDGRIAFTAARLVSRSPSALANLSGVAMLDHQRLTIAPLRFGLTRGTLEGSVVVDQRGGARAPLVTLSLDLADSHYSVLAGDDRRIEAPVDGRIRLVGRGVTVREAVGRSSGTIGLVAREGTLLAKLAVLLGFDIGRGVFTDSEKHTALRCIVARVELRDGKGAFVPLIVDTSLSRLDGTGTIVFPDERIAATLRGAPKRSPLLRISGAIEVGGTIRKPHVDAARGTRSVGNILRGVGRALTGRSGPIAEDADCQTLARQALVGRR